MTLRSIEQERAHTAIAAVGKVPKDDAKAYVSRALQLPAMIQNLGLASTISFLMAKADKVTADQLLAGHLAEWLLKPESGIAWSAGAIAGNARGGGALQRAISWRGTKPDEATSWTVYMQAQHEALHYAAWLKRWSKATLEVKDAKPA